jgi:Spy/CpxP family protein refolding chaperone
MRPRAKAFGLAALALATGVALAQGPGMGGGPGGYGPGAMGPGMGMGSGMAMMGPGGMRGGGWGYQDGAGMMGWGDRSGMMGFGYSMQSALGLSDDQRKKLDAIHDELQSRNWEIMGKVRVEMSRMRELMSADPRDKAALDATFKRISDLRQQRFDARLAAHEQMESLLTKEQRQQLRRWGPWWMHDAG